MILELLYILSAISIAFIFASLILVALSKTATVPLMLAGLLLLTTGLVIASEGLQVTNGHNEYCDEDSFYWNCTTTITNCSGTPEQDSCIYYNIDQCLALMVAGENCTWIPDPEEQPYCYGTPEWTCTTLWQWGQQNGYGDNKCTETPGCTLEQTPEPALCDNILTNCTTTITYTNHTANYTGPFTEIDVLYYLYILGGLFFFMWGTMVIFERKESAVQPTEER